MAADLRRLTETIRAWTAGPEGTDRAAGRIADRHFITARHDRPPTGRYLAANYCTCGWQHQELGDDALPAIESVRRATIGHYLDAYRREARP